MGAVLAYDHRRHPDFGARPHDKEPVNEATLVKELEKALKAEMRGCTVQKHNDASTAGIPDLSVTWRGRTAWVEVKYDRPRARAEVSELQKLALRRLGGYLAWYALSPSGVRTTSLSGPGVELIVDRKFAHVDVARALRLRLEASEAATMVRAFHDKFGLVVRDTPEWDQDAADRRVEHIREEFKELEDAVLEPSMPETADALADIVYLCYGLAANLGIPLDAVIREVQRANMDKVRDDGPARKFGIKKPEGWRGPDVEGVLKRAGWTR
jgi:NTP pyrophosphatase (non-canonical NTP hydrolase)